MAPEVYRLKDILMGLCLLRALQKRGWEKERVKEEDKIVFVIFQWKTQSLQLQLDLYICLNGENQ